MLLVFVGLLQLELLPIGGDMVTPAAKTYFDGVDDLVASIHQNGTVNLQVSSSKDGVAKRKVRYDTKSPKCT